MSTPERTIADVVWDILAEVEPGAADPTREQLVALCVEAGFDAAEAEPVIDGILREEAELAARQKAVAEEVEAMSQEEVDREAQRLGFDAGKLAEALEKAGREAGLGPSGPLGNRRPT